MTVCGKPGKTIKLFSHPSHKPWKSLRDSHIPSALRLIISIQFSNQKRSLPQLPIPLTFRLILQLEKTEVKKISLVTMAALCSSSSRKEVIIDGAPNILRALALHEPAPGQRKVLRLEHFDMQCRSIGS
jgi:hypothetical protein